jgi:hypothetical protein
MTLKTYYKSNEKYGRNTDHIFHCHSLHSTDDLLSGHTQFLINFTISYDTNNINEILFLQKINQIHSPLPRLLN